MNRGRQRTSVLLVLALAFVGTALARAEATNTVTLARHETVAEYEGSAFRRCMGRTSLCPDACGQSGTVATFKIIQYLAYEKTGEYGDPKCEQFVFMVEDNMKHAKVSADIRDTVNSLKKGARVQLSWNHDYVTVNGSSWPERPVTKLRKVAGNGEGQAVPAAKAEPVKREPR